MLGYAPQNERITYREAPAEALPFEDDSFDLITVGLAFHWFDQARFLGEAVRVLKPLGCLAIYNDGFSGVMVGNPAYEAWNRERYLPRFPSPPRNLRAATDEDWERSGLRHMTKVQFAHDVEASIGDWCGYLMTQSNVIAALEAGSDSPESVQAWLVEELRTLNAKEEGIFRFCCTLEVYQLQRG